MASLKALSLMLPCLLLSLHLLCVAGDVAAHPAMPPAVHGHHHRHNHSHHHAHPPMAAPNQTHPAHPPVSAPNQTHPAHPPLSAPNQTHAAHPPVSAPNQTHPAHSPVSAPNQTHPSPPPSTPHAPAPAPAPHAPLPSPISHPPPPSSPHVPPPVAPAPPKATPHPPLAPRPRTFVAVQGVVYCKPCKYVGVSTFLGASPLKGATVKVQCNNTKYSKYSPESKGTTDSNGYFLVTAPKTVTNYGAHRCKAFLVSSPNATCSVPTNVNGGISGGLLRPGKPFTLNKLPFSLYSTGPFAFDPKCSK